MPILPILILFRCFLGKEHKTRWLERLAISPKSPQDFANKNPLIWLHAVSVGESNSAWVLIDEILKLTADFNILFTSTTLTSAQLINQKISQNQLYQSRIIHQFFPLDGFFIINKFLDKWHPQKALLIESEIWPNLIFNAQKKAIGLFLLNARLSDRSCRRWLQLKKMGFNIFNNFSMIFAQSNNDKEKLIQLSENVEFYGNLKNISKSLTVDLAKLKIIKNQIDQRKVWLCASTHKNEEKIILATHQKLKKHFPDLLTIIAIRHPKRADEVVELCRQNNIKIAQRSLDQTIDNEVAIYLVDTLGELGIFYSLCRFALIGGSLLANIGGHNPFEAMQLDCVVISGQFYENFSDIYNDIKKYQTGIIVNNADELYLAIYNFLENPQKIDEYKVNLSKVFDGLNVIDEIVKKLF